MNARFARWLCLVLLSAVTVRSAVVDDRIAEGRAALAAHNLSLARSKFTEARAADATNPTAAALLGLTRWFALVGDAPANAVLTGGGVSTSGRDLYNWSAKLGKNAAGDTALPTGYNLEAQRSFWRDTIIPTSVAARADFAAVTDDAFVLTLSAAEVNSGDPADTITLDRADLLTLQASLRAFEMLVQVSLGQNMSADYARLLRVAQADTLTFRQAMEENPDLLKAGPLENRLAAKEALLDFVNLYRRASSAVRARPLGLDRLFMLDTAQDLSDEADFRRYLTSLEKSATDYVEVDNGAEHISLAPLATAGWSIRGSLPAMTNGRFDPTTIGDASLGGVVLGLRREFFAQKLVEAGYTADLGWNLITPSFNSGLQKYAYTGTHHIVTGTNGTLGRSADGATWTFQQFPQAQDLFSIATNGSGVVVAVGNTQVWRSADHGATWSLVHTTWRKTAPDNEGGMFGLVWNGSRFTAITAGGYVWNSPDGLTWTRGNRIQPLSIGVTIGGLDYDAGRFVATGVVTQNNLTRGAIFTSTDGANWVLSFTGAANTTYRTAVYGNGRWVAAGNVGRVAYSTNGGTNWAEISTGNTADNFSGSTFASGQFYLGGTRVGTSADGINWTFTNNPETVTFADAVAGPGGAVYLPGGGGALYRYASGTFTRLDNVTTALARNAAFNESVAFNGKIYTTGSNGTITETSGNTVTVRQTPVTSSLSCITVHNGQLFAGGSLGTIVSSTDGVTWQLRVTNDSTLTLSSINDLFSVNGQLLAGTSSVVLVSVDNGATWARRALPAASSATLAIGYGGGFYVLGQLGTQVNGVAETVIVSSTDLVNFTRMVLVSTPPEVAAASVRQVLFQDGKFHVYLSNGRVVHSVSANPNDGFTGDWDTNGTIVGGGIQAGTFYATTQRTNDESRSGFNYSFDAADWVRTELPTSEFIAGTLADLGGRLYTSGGTSIYRATKSLARPGPTAGSQVIIPARVGQSITVAAPITSSEDLTYQWSFNGSPIVGATGASLNLSQVTADQAGTYTVTATGRLTGATATNTVTVLVVAGTPTITQQPAGGLAKAGGSFTFTVTAAGTAPLSYQWFRNNQRLATATAATLTLANVTTNDAGDYRVEVSNASGTVISSDARLAVSSIGSAPAFWEDSESFFAPSRLISDGQGRFYAMWNIYGRAQDVVGGVHVGSLARFNEATGAVDPTFVWDEKLGSPLFLCVQTDGKLIVATNQAAGEGATVIRLNTDGSLDNTFAAPRFSRSIRFMRLQSDGKVLLAATDGVSDSSVQGMIVATNPTVYRLTATGALDNTFAPVDLGTNGTLLSPLAVDTQGRVYLLGSFASVNGTTRRGVARVSSTGVLDSFADPATLPTGWNTSALGRAIAFQSDGRPVIAGRFGYTARGNTSTNPILAIRFNLDGTFDTTFAQPLRSETPINASIGFYGRWIEVTAGDKFYLTCDRVMRFNANGTLDTTWAPNNTGYSKELFWLMVSPTTGNLYVPDLNEVSGNILALTPAGAPLAGFNAGGFGTTRTPDDAILLADGRLLAAGNFDHFGGTVQPGTALFGTNGVLAGDATAFHDPGVIFTNPWATVFRWPDRSFGVVRAELGDPITGAGFDVKAARFNPDGSTRAGWELAEANPSTWNYAPTPDGGLLLWRVSPSATDVLNQGNSAWIRRYNPDGSANATTFGDFSAFTLITRNGSNAITNIESGQVNDLQVVGDGSFLALVAGRDGNVSLRRYRPDGTPDAGYTSVTLGTATVTAGFTSVLYDPVVGTSAQYPITNYSASGYRLRALPDGSAYVAGRLTVGGVSRSLVKLTATGAVDATVADLTLGFTNTTGLPPRISGLGLDDSARLYLAGRFDSVNGTAAAGLARLTPAGAFDAAWAPDVQIVDPLATGVLFAAGNGWLHILGPVMSAGDLRPTGYKRVPLTATAPAIIGQTASRTVNEGQSVQLFAGVFGGGDMTYSWTRNGTALTGGNQPFLDLGKVTSATAGTYVLTATNSAGTVQSTAIVLTVSNLPAIEVAPKAVTAVEGGAASFSVQASSSFPLSYQWRRNGTPIDGATSATLVLTGVTAGQAGNYTVVVTNAAGSTTSAAAVLTVTPLAAAPTIRTQLLGQTVYSGYVVSLSVAVTPPAGSTISSYKWYLNGALSGTTNTSGTTVSLLVSAPAPGVSNSYQVVVTSSNGGSVTSATATLTGGNPAYATSTFAGANTRGSADGTGSAARFAFPEGAASDAAGNVYVADSFNHTIRKITPAGVVTTVAGVAGTNSTVDGSLAAARFSNPVSVIVAPNGDIYVLQLSVIRKISGGNVITFAGSTTSGAADGTGTAARFRSLSRGVIDSSGNLYVSDAGNHAIRKITPAGIVTTVAGTLGVSGYADGALGVGRLNNPCGLALKSNGTLLIVDGFNSALRQADASGNLTTIVGSPPPNKLSGTTDAVGTAARLSSPQDIALDPGTGIAYVVDGSYTIRRIAADLTVTTVAGSPFQIGFADSTTGTNARFNFPRGIAWMGNAHFAITDMNSNTIRSFGTAGDVSTLAGLAPGSVDGTGSAARFFLPIGVVADGSGNFIVSDYSNRVLRKVTPAGVVTTFSGIVSTSTVAMVDGPATTARYVGPRGLARHPSTGEIYVVDSGTIRKVAADGTVTVFAGSSTGAVGTTDGVGNTARFGGFGTLAFAPNGDLFVADELNHTIRRVTADGTVSTIAGVAGSSGNVDGSLASGAPLSPVRFASPCGIAVDASGNIFVAQNSGNIRKIDSAGNVTTLTGVFGSLSNLDGGPLGARLGSLQSLTLGGDGNLYVGSGGCIYRIHPTTGVVATLLGSAFAPGFLDASGSSARVSYVSGLAVAADGTITFVDSNNGVIRRAVTAPAITFTTQPTSQTVATGASVTLTAAATGVSGIAYQWTKNGSDLANGGNVSGATTATLTLTNVTLGDAASYAVRASSGASVAVSSLATLTVGTAEANDNFANAAALTGASGTVAGNNTTATGETGEPVHFSNTFNDSSSLWYAYRPIASGVVTFDTIGSSIDTVLAAYTGSAVNNLTFLAQNNDAATGTTASQITIPVTAGTTYYIAVASNTNTRGAFVLNHSLSITPQPSATVLGAGQSVSLAVSPNATLNPAVTQQWRRDGVDLAGATSATLANQTTAGVYTVGFAQGGAYDYSRTEAIALLSIPAGGASATDSFAGTGLSSAWNATPLTSVPDTDTAFIVNDRLEFTTLNSFPPAVYRQADRADTLPLDRNWSVAVRAAMNPSALPNMLGTGSVRETGFSLIATNTVDANDYHRVVFRYRNDTGTPRFERYTQTTTNGTTAAAAGVATLTNKSALLRFDYDAATGMLTSSVSSGGSSFTSVGSFNLLSAWAVARTGSIRIGLRGHAELVNIPAAAVWADDYVQAIQPAPGPVITTQPLNVSAADGSSITLTVGLSATTAGTPTYQWFKDGVAIVGATGSSYSDVAVAGSYTVAVTLNGQTVTSSAAIVTTTPSAPAFGTIGNISSIFGVGGYVLPAGSSAYLQTGLIAGTSPVTYQWNFNGNAIPGATGPTYYLPNWQTANGGAYSVTATNSLGTVTSPAEPFWVTPEGGWRWRNPTPTGNGATRVAYLNGQFLLGGLRGTYMVSPDGVNWTTRQVPAENNLFNFQYTAGRYVAMASLNAIFTSTDGIIWTPRTTGINGAQTSLQDMIASPTRLVALGAGGVTAVSADGGLNWTVGSLGSGATDTLFGATYTLNKFWGASGDTGRIFSSTDGVTWTSVATPAKALRGLVYGAGRLVAVGADGVIVTSPDGTNWTLAQSGTTNQLLGVNFVNGRFVAVGVLGTILTSPDGLVWTPRSAAGNQSNLQNTAFGNGRYVIAGQGGRVILTSTDSENWSVLTAGPAQNFNLLGVTASSSTAVTVGAAGTILTSTDKVAWTNRTTANTNTLNDVHYALGKFMAVGNTGSVMTSTDEGATWTWQSTSAAIGSTGLNGVRYSPVISRWIVAGNGGGIFTAADGTTFTWTRQTTGTSQNLRKVAVSSSLHVVVGNAGTILSSADGTTWTARTSGTTLQLNDVAFGNNTWVAVGNIGTVVTSGDAATWTAKQLGSFNFTSVNYLNGAFIATGGSNAYFTSTDGINWTGRTTGAADPLNDNVLFGGEVVGVGNFGTILTAGTPEIAGGGTINAPANSPVTLKFAVGNSPVPVTYTWTKDGNAYAGPNSPVLTFASATGGDAGVYRVTATNAFGSALSSPYTLSLNVAVAITVAPTPQTALAGGTATFSVTATGTPAPTYQWRRNGIDLVGATSSTLTFTNLHPNDAGEISVAVTNASGTVVSTPVALTVNPVAPVIQGPLSAFAVAGAPFLYQINTNATAATFGATGLPNGLTLATASGVISGTPTQTGPFNVSLTATNVSGSDTQMLALTVQPPVPVITSVASASARVGQAFSYTITAANSPTSFLAFNLPAGLSLTGATISGTPTTAGFYAAQVSAANATGIASQGLSIQVQPPLDAPVYSGPANISGTAGAAFTFTPNFGGSVASWALVNLPDSTPSTLPTGITLNPTTGVISGTTTQSGTFRIALQATAGSGATTTQVLTFTFNPPASAPLVTSSGSAVGTVGSLFSYTITTNPAATTFGATGLPDGLTLNTGTGVITGFPTAPGISTVTLTVGNLTGSSTTPLTITVNSSASAPIITSAPVATGTVEVDFVFSLAASNSPTNFAVTSGSLPAGLTLNAATGALTGKPTAPGQIKVWVAASNVAGGRGPAVEMLFDIARALNVPVITSNGTAAGQVGQPFRYQINATNTPTGYALTGTLPGGLTFDSATGVISGVPSSETAAPVSVTLTASNADGASAPKTLSITIAPAPATPRVTSTLAASGRVGVAFTYQITASDTPTSYSSDALPAGLALNATSGAITGTPSAAGVFPVQIRAANAAGLGQASTLTITIASPLLAPAITSDATANAKVGVLFSYQITATGDPTSFNVTGTLPAGLSLNTTTGLLSGNPADNPGLYTVTLTATNAAGTSQPQSLLINVAPADATPVITSSATAVGQVNVPFTYQITATNVPSTTPFPPSVFLDAVGLPPGLAVNPSTGLIQGTPSAAGTYTVSLVGINANGTGALRSLTITISPAATAPVIGGSLAVNAQAGTAFSYQIVATNNPTSFGALDAPVWLSVNTATGLLSGTPTGPGAYTIRLTASNSGGTSNEAALSLTVYAAPNTPVVTNGDTATGRVGQAFTYQITASNSPTSYVATGLPAGLTFNGTAGTISGTPTTSGTFTVTLSAVNANGEGNRVTLTVKISPSLSVVG